MYSNRQILILGMGRSGIAAAKLAKYYHANVTILDNGHSEAQQKSAEELRMQGIEVILGFSGDSWAKAVDLVVVSPGLSRESSLGRLADSRYCEVISELEFGYRHCHCPIIAITGTNGKTTTTELTTHCLKALGHRVVSAGNIGYPLCEAALLSNELDYLVVEVSSFQLERCCDFSPYVAVCLNVTPDHLDRHGTMANYFLTKMSLFRHITAANRIVVRKDIAEDSLFVQYFGEAIAESVTTFAYTDSAATYFVANGFCCVDGADSQNLMSVKDIPMLGRHNVENVLAVFAILKNLGLDGEEIATAVMTFKVAPHRMELVSHAEDILYINDSKATNADAMKQAILSISDLIPGKICLIAGGLDKDIDFSQVTAILGDYVKKIFLIGKCRDKLYALWNEQVPCVCCESFDEAIVGACDEAQKNDAVLLAPGCASMDMFKDYAERGEIFAATIKKILKKLA